MRGSRPRVSRSLSARSLLRGRVPRWRRFESRIDRVKREVRERDRYRCRICEEPGKRHAEGGMSRSLQECR